MRAPIIVAVNGVRKSGVAVDPDAQAIIDRIISAGGTLSTTGRSGINTFVGTLKSASIWSGIERLYGFAGETNAAHAVDWKNPTVTANDITWNGTITSDINGSYGDGSSYGDIPYNAGDLDPASFNLTINSRTGGNGGGLNFGADDGSSFVWEAVNHNGALDVIAGSFSTRYTRDNTLPGQLSMEVSGGSRKTYFNGALVHTDAPTVTLPSLNFWCFGRNDNGSLSDGNTKNLCLIVIGGPLGDVNQGILNDAVNALRFALTGFPLVAARIQTHNNQTSSVQVLNMSYDYGNQDYQHNGGSWVGLTTSSQYFTYTAGDPDPSQGTWQFVDSVTPANNLSTDAAYPGVDPTEVSLWYNSLSVPVSPAPTLTLVNRDFATITGLWQDTGATTPVANLGDPIAAGTDVISGSTIALTQDTGTAQPTLRFSKRASDGVYVPIIATDGTDDFLSTPFNLGPVGSLPRTLAFGVALSGDVNSRRSLGGIGNTGTGNMFAAATWDSPARWMLALYAVDVFSDDTPDNDWHAHVTKYDGSQVTWEKDGVMLADFPATVSLDTTNSPLYVGKRPDGSMPVAAGYTSIILFTHSLTAAESTAVTNYIRSLNPA